jgi:hypothetical protein
MNDEQNSAAEQFEEDLNTTPPNPEPPPPVKNSSGWQMPEPIFRQSEGYTPEGHQRVMDEARRLADANENVDIGNLTMMSSKPASAGAQPKPTETQSALVEPQPELDITEEFDAPEPQQPPATPVKRSGAGRVIFILLGLLLIGGFVVLFLFLIYYLFFMHGGSGTLG